MDLKEILTVIRTEKLQISTIETEVVISRNWENRF